MEWTRLPQLLTEAGIATDEQAAKLAALIAAAEAAEGDAYLGTPDGRAALAHVQQHRR